MRLKHAIYTLVVVFSPWAVAFAVQSPEKQYSKVDVNRLFLDARAPDIPPTYSRSELKTMIRDADKAEDFERLANYFEYQAMEFEQKSQEQLKELQRLLALPYHARSYPEQVDRTRDLIKRYKARALECSTRADSYRERAKVGSETNQYGIAAAK